MALIPSVVIRPSHPGASPSLLIEDLEDRALVQAICAALPKKYK